MRVTDISSHVDSNIVTVIINKTAYVYILDSFHNKMFITLNPFTTTGQFTGQKKTSM